MQEVCGFAKALRLAPVLKPLINETEQYQLLGRRVSRAVRHEHVSRTLRGPSFLQLLLAAGLAPPGRRIYINIGARGPARDSSTTLHEHYPGAENFIHHAFEADSAFNDVWQNASRHDKRIRYHNVAAWTENTMLQLGMRSAASHVLDTTTGIYKDDHKVKSMQQVRAIDFARWLSAHVQRRDFVVLKIDIEGAEYAVLPSLLANHGTVCLIDEIFLECHMRDMVKGRGKGDCIALLRAFTAEGALSHVWF